MPSFSQVPSDYKFFKFFVLEFRFNPKPSIISKIVSSLQTEEASGQHLSPLQFK